MGVSVVSKDADGVLLAAPLLPNLNHRNTAFGGSISALALLSGWTLVHIRLQTLPGGYRVVIQSNTVKYLAPIASDFQAYCAAPPEQDWQRFITTVAKWGKGRIKLSAKILAAGVLAGTFEGEYVAIKSTD